MSRRAARRLNAAGIAWRAAQDVPPGGVVNIGIGLPEQVVAFIAGKGAAMLHSENGILGMGPSPHPSRADADLINAGKKPMTILPGGSYFHHADAFAMIRGGHIDLCIMGAFQVSASGDLANWSLGRTNVPPAVGGAMDLATGARRLFVLMTHVTARGEPKLVRRLSLPLTAKAVVDMVYTDLAVLKVEGEVLEVREIVEGISLKDLERVTDAPLRPAKDLGVLCAPHPLKSEER